MIHVCDPRRYDRLPPVEKLLSLVFALAGRDRAIWLRLDYYPEPPDMRMWYCLDAQPYEMVPPPGELWPDMFHFLWRNTRLSPADRLPWWRRRIGFPERPVSGVLPVRYEEVVVDFNTLFFRGRTGERVWMERPRSANVVAVSEEFLRRRLRRPGDTQ